LEKRSGGDIHLYRFFGTSRGQTETQPEIAPAGSAFGLISGSFKGRNLLKEFFQKSRVFPPRPFQPDNPLLFVRAGQDIRALYPAAPLSAIQEQTKASENLVRQGAKQGALLDRHNPVAPDPVETENRPAAGGGCFQLRPNPVASILRCAKGRQDFKIAFPPQAVKGIAQVLFFEGNLVGVAQVLQVASPTNGENRTKRPGSLPGRPFKGSELRLEVILFSVNDLDSDPVSRGGEGDKDDLPFRPSYPFPAVDNLFDIHRQSALQFFSAPCQGIA
jgi:hypothetical protein